MPPLPSPPLIITSVAALQSALRPTTLCILRIASVGRSSNSVHGGQSENCWQRRRRRRRHRSIIEHDISEFRKSSPVRTAATFRVPLYIFFGIRPVCVIIYHDWFTVNWTKAVPPPLWNNVNLDMTWVLCLPSGLTASVRHHIVMIIVERIFPHRYLCIIILWTITLS